MIVEFRERLARLIGRRPPDMQVAALCLNEASGDVLLVTSRGTGRWIVPKGWPMAGRSLADAARQEAWEEAGVKGRVGEVEIGRYHYDKDQDRGFAIPVEVRVFPLYVEALETQFPEAQERQRRWFAPQDAARMVAETGLQQILRRLPAERRHPPE
ncbi:NUDIX hydrolase [Paracoccus sp. P2]|uniref:NUDIX hydrolase n=1 Tax=Paracoccus pantotrophus TaxID=82367 RepID=A0A7H9BUS6_PARPN|nr:NUDIX hydrolase [Paracoccus pantotrophus]MDF3853319.1 NUDIX hydrolase [Paracoccus pantotrophus]QLH14606.1 NUDIX hydrolase [Paracoccus pantotrophus]RDD98518.1 NUDIX domain-containing protein [Paracoccus pantotrophus]RNI18807.1 NUDIX domain-containing protein [Paracoccus pantotrophus]WGR64736.1 NUDIX hydrolase [Paracoccus pantotrophus]